MIQGIILSVLISILIIVIAMVIHDVCYETWAERTTFITTIVLVIACTVGCAFAGASIKNTNIEKDYYGYMAIKETYEAAVTDKKLSGLERIEITKTAIEQNMLLARKKVDMCKWYSFDITDKNKDLILGLQPIGID